MSLHHDENRAKPSSPPRREGTGVVDPEASTSPSVTRHTNLPALKAIRRDLRNNATRAERALWNVLKGRQLQGRKFRRQHSVGRYVLDFYCPDERLAVELDGSVHDDPLRRAHDAARQAYLERMGIRVLRFQNREVLAAPDQVAAAIAMHFHLER